MWVSIPRRDTLRRIAGKLSSPTELARYIRWRLGEGNEYAYFDFADAVPAAAAVIARLVPSRRDLGAPVFLAGLRRSGTTLFYRIMNAHPALMLFNERFPGDRYRGHGRSTQANIWSITDEARFRRVALRYLSPAVRLSRPRWGVKLALELAHPDPGSVSADGLKLIARGFPRSHILGITRDPRDQVLSAMSRAGRGAQFWIDEYHALLDLFQELEEARSVQFRAIRYEDLVTQTEQTIASCCALLGIEPSPSMLRPSQWSSKGPAAYESDRIVAQVDKWSKAGPESRSTIDLVTRHCFPAAERFGYSTEPMPGPSSARGV